MRKFSLVAILFASLLLSCSTKQDRTKLAVVIVIDQFPNDYLDRFSDLFGNGGFKRLMNDGAYYTNANYTHAVTQTGPGHANISTGSNPHRHGIVANTWYNNLGGKIPCVACINFKEVGSSGVLENGSACPQNLMAPSLGDLLQAQNDSSKVWSISLKDRSAILMGGKKPDGAFWFSSEHGEFISSQYYGETLPQWCIDFNKSKEPDSYFGKTWDRMLADSVYANRCDVDSAAYEDFKSPLPNTFPKIMNGGLNSPGQPFYDDLEASPFANELVLHLAEKAVLSESLGKDNVPDILWVSLSSNDLVGHVCGPHSHEVLDMTIRTDKQIENFLNFLDKNVGKNNYVVALSSDHGIAPAPESKLTKFKAGRINFSALRDSMNVMLNTALSPDADPPIEFVKSVFIPYVFINPEAVKQAGALMNMTAMRVTTMLRQNIAVEQAHMTYNLSDIYNLPQNSLQGRILRNFYENRTSQVYMSLKPGWLSTDICTTHGTVHEYDTHVPVIFYGAPFKSGHYKVDADPCDIAVTLAPVLGLNLLKDVDGHLRKEGLKDGILKEEKK